MCIWMVYLIPVLYWPWVPAKMTMKPAVSRLVTLPHNGKQFSSNGMHFMAKNICAAYQTSIVDHSSGLWMVSQKESTILFRLLVDPTYKLFPHFQVHHAYVSPEYIHLCGYKLITAIAITNYNRQETKEALKG